MHNGKQRIMVKHKYIFIVLFYPRNSVCVVASTTNGSSLSRASQPTVMARFMVMAVCDFLTAPMHCGKLVETFHMQWVVHI